MIKIGNSSGFWGDQIEASARLLAEQPDLDYLTLDYLAEVSIGIMAIQREKDPAMGYAADFIAVIQSLIPHWRAGVKCKIITNGGGLQPEALAHRCDQVLRAAGMKRRIGVILGDDLLPQMLADPDDPCFANLETGAPLSTILPDLMTGNAYLGSSAIAEALRLGAEIVISGRIADPSLTVGPSRFHFGWGEDAYDRLAGATVAGHLIECGTQVTGGISTDWLTHPALDQIGYPIAEIDETGTCVITKPLGTGGRVSERTVKEQLLYEVGDPSCYLSPDVKVSFLDLQVQDEGSNRVQISGARGSPPPSSYKVGATYRAGYKVEAYLTFFGERVVEKARRAGETVIAKLEKQGYHLDQVLIETIGAGAVVPGIAQSNPLECVLRISARDRRKEALEYLGAQIAPLVTAGPQGTTGYMSGRPHVRPVCGFWPCLIERQRIKESVYVF